MTNGRAPIGAEALLAHQDFVLALARSLLRDEDAARDVAQETWLAALTRPPRSLGSLRAWLARVARSRASDRLRVEARRERHERLAAQERAGDPGDAVREEVALHQRVVEAVLALREPYRRTILLHHYEGLSAGEIARREAVPAGTVRARISRGHALLRERLDDGFGGSRSAWALALGSLLERWGGGGGAAKLWIACGAAAAAAAVPVILSIPRAEPEPSVLAASPTVVRGATLAGLSENATSLETSVDASLEPAGPRFGRVAVLPAGQGGNRRTKQDPGTIANGGFDARAGKDGGIDGWEIVVGAKNGAEAPLSTVEVDTRERREGKASLHVAGDDTTRAWRTVVQEVPARPGGTYHVRAWAKTKDVRQETVKGTSIRQFRNCFVGLFLLDDNGEVVARDFETPGLPTSGWQRLELELEAPDTARTARLSVSLTMSGSLWVDAVEMEVEGGRELPASEVLEALDFERGSGLPAGWEEEVGATNGTGSSRSSIAIDHRSGAGGSRSSLRFTGKANTIRWYGLKRTFEAAPGDAFTLTAMARAEDVRQEGIQFANFHARIVFLDPHGETIGTPVYAHPGEGTYEWKEVSVANVAPEGTAQALVGLFLSMSGDAWFDDVRVERRRGGRPAYADWLSLETPHLLLRYPADHPRAASMEAYAERLEEAYQDVVRRLEVRDEGRITMFLYRDGEQGKRLTGRELDFADAEGRTVHQRPNSTLSHEVSHCVALRIGYAKAALFGEGIAVYLNGSPPEVHHDLAAELLAKGELPPLEALVGAFRDQQQGYPAAGSFCGWLIETYGIGPFKRLYAADDPSAAASDVIGRDLGGLDEEWRAFLRGRN